MRDLPYSWPPLFPEGIGSRYKCELVFGLSLRISCLYIAFQLVFFAIVAPMLFEVLSGGLDGCKGDGLLCRLNPLRHSHMLSANWVAPCMTFFILRGPDFCSSQQVN